jgi:hypothetical protein
LLTFSSFGAGSYILDTSGFFYTLTSTLESNLGLNLVYTGGYILVSTFFSTFSYSLGASFFYGSLEEANGH